MLAILLVEYGSTYTKIVYHNDNSKPFTQKA